MRKTVIALALVLGFVFAGALAATAGPDLEDDWGARVEQTGFGLRDAVTRALEKASTGTPCEAELEMDGGVLVYSIDLAQGEKTHNVVFDAKTGAAVEDVVEADDRSAVIAPFGTIGLLEGIDAAAKACAGTPFYAVLVPRPEHPVIVVAAVDGEDRVKVVIVNGETGAAEVRDPRTRAAVEPPKGATADGKEFTDRFPEDRLDLGPTGRNPYFLLEPGWFWVLEGTEGGKSLIVTYTVLDQTRTIDGVECRAVESREVLDGVLKELTLDYYAISAKTANVYYFGEAVDEYRDGKVVGHEGQWFAGEKGCRWGLMVPAVPLIGARHYQEIAPGIAMDRVEIVSTTEVVKTPAGTFEDVMVQEETNPEEPGHVDHKYYAPGIGMVKEEENLVLTKFGRR